MAVIEEWDVGFDMGDEEVYTPVPPGTYEARCDNIERREGSGGGFFNLFWKMVITDGEMKNRSIQGVTTLKPDVPHIGFLQACSSLRPDIELQGTKFKPSNYVGRKCVIEVIERKFTGNDGAERTTSSINSFRPLPVNSGGVEAKEAEGTEVSDATFDA